MAFLLIKTVIIVMVVPKIIDNHISMVQDLVTMKDIRVINIHQDLNEDKTGEEKTIAEVLVRGIKRNVMREIRIFACHLKTAFQV